MTDFSPREIVSELDRFIIGQHDAKRAVAIALRNRWRRLQLDEKLREEVLPKNILMIGTDRRRQDRDFPSPRRARRARRSSRSKRPSSPRSVTSAATSNRSSGDLVEVAIAQTREKKRKDVLARAQLAAEERVINALVGETSGAATKEIVPPQTARWRIRTTRKSRSKYSRAAAACRCSTFPACRARQMGAISIGDIFGKLGGKPKTRRMTVAESHDILINDEADKLLDTETLVQESIKVVENNGIVFLDEIDKITARDGRVGGDVSREACSAICCR